MFTTENEIIRSCWRQIYRLLDSSIFKLTPPSWRWLCWRGRRWRGVGGSWPQPRGHRASFSYQWQKLWWFRFRNRWKCFDQSLWRKSRKWGWKWQWRRFRIGYFPGKFLFPCPYCPYLSTTWFCTWRAWHFLPMISLDKILYKYLH